VLLESHPVTLGVAAGILAVATAAFALSLPSFRSPIDRTMLGTPAPVHDSAARVRRTFADYGVRLRYTSHPARGVVVLGVTPPPYAPTALTVTLPSAGGLEVHDGGSNRRVRARVAAAIAALRR